MALQLTTQTNFGVDGNYWKITLACMDTNSKSLMVNISLYKDESTSSTNGSPLDSRNYMWSGDDFDTIMTETNYSPGISYLYDKIKVLPEFDGSIDA